MMYSFLTKDKLLRGEGDEGKLEMEPSMFTKVKLPCRVARHNSHPHYYTILNALTRPQEETEYEYIFFADAVNAYPCPAPPPPPPPPLHTRRSSESSPPPSDTDSSLSFSRPSSPPLPPPPPLPQRERERIQKQIESLLSSQTRSLWPRPPSPPPPDPQQQQRLEEERETLRAIHAILRPAPRRRTGVGEEEVEAALRVQADLPSFQTDVTRALGLPWAGFVGVPFAGVTEEGEEGEEQMSMLFPLFEEEDENLPPMIPGEDDDVLVQSLAGLSLEDETSVSQAGEAGAGLDESMSMPPLAVVPDTDDEEDSEDEYADIIPPLFDVSDTDTEDEGSDFDASLDEEEAAQPQPQPRPPLEDVIPTLFDVSDTEDEGFDSSDSDTDSESELHEEELQPQLHENEDQDEEETSRPRPPPRLTSTFPPQPNLRDIFGGSDSEDPPSAP
ncbi:hypothetical protein V5O48_007796 [Marasmius crinis-equi]|uniref:Uncharacterized protein n=1 Tax=Marasmius crinis-equi TaxID=585013 RepID=A0ABR3FFR5_9AGAR